MMNLKARAFPEKKSCRRQGTRRRVSWFESTGPPESRRRLSC